MGDKRDFVLDPPRCDYCGKPARLVLGVELYPAVPSLRRDRFWYCALCGAWVGVHRNSPRCAPKGSLANKTLRSLRARVHAAFDPLWQGGRTEREQAYAWLAKRLEIPVAECHVGYFRDAQCVAALQILEEHAHA